MNWCAAKTYFSSMLSYICTGRGQRETLAQGTWFRLKVLLQAGPLVPVQVEMCENFGLCTRAGEFSGLVLSRKLPEYFCS